MCINATKRVLPKQGNVRIDVCSACSGPSVFTKQDSNSARKSFSGTLPDGMYFSVPAAASVRLDSQNLAENHNPSSFDVMHHGSCNIVLRL